MNILIVEDSLAQAISIEKTLNKSYPRYKTYICTNYTDAITILDNYNFSVFILDIDLGEGLEKNGLSIANYIRSKHHYINSPILFLTSLPSEINIAINDIHCYSYLLKPYSEPELLKSFYSLQNSSLLPAQMLEIRDPNGIYYHLDPTEIIYIEIYNHRLIIYTKATTFETNAYTISSFCNYTNNLLIQCHKSYAVNPKEIINYSANNITVSVNKQNISIPIGRRYKNNLIKELSYE